MDEVATRLSGLSAVELRVVRDYEERNKNRDTILEQLDRRIKSGSYAPNGYVKADHKTGAH